MVGCSIALAATVGWYSARQREQLHVAIARELSAVADGKSVQIANWRRERIGDGRVVASSCAAAAGERLLAGRANPTDRADLFTALAALKKEFRYAGAMLVEADGEVVTRLDNEAAGETNLPKSQRSKLAVRALEGGDAVLSDINRETRSGNRVLTVSAPVGVAGALILEIDPASFLDPYLRSWPGPSRSGVTLLIRRDGDDVVYLSGPLVTDPAHQVLRRPLKAAEIGPESEYEAGKLVRTVDYRGVEVLEEIRRVPQSDWYVVAKVDAAEVEWPIVRLSTEMGLIFVLILMTNIAGVGMIWKSRQLRIHHESEERFKAIANDTPALLWMTSADRRDTFLNKQLSTFLGTGEEQSSADWTDYLHPEDQDDVRAALQACFSARREYSGEFRIRRVDGRYRWVAGRGAPRLAPGGGFMGFAGALLDVTDRRDAEQQLRDANEALTEGLAEKSRKEDEIRALTARLIDAQEEERARLGRELHDDLSQQIAALSISIGNLKRALPESQEATRVQSDRIQQTVVGLSEAVRRISHELHPAILQHAGLAVAIRSHCEVFESLTGIHVALSTSGEFGNLPMTVALNVYRIAQEALRNIAKHAHVNDARLELVRSESELRLTVSDEGAGMKEEAAGRRTGLGLVSIAERARLIGGVVHFQSRPGKGTVLEVRIDNAHLTLAAEILC